ncbi:SCO3242 family prenyltransferase [Streptomyces sp. NPDC090029]|uniref:SCO3242 family prenyltransferase n=1 Tax=Streptomyces sp. NPDC090029 TaxID=3365924 RepID=UPI00381E90FD
MTPPAVGGAPIGRPSDWAELLRLPAGLTVPGDALTGASATGGTPHRRTWLAAAASLCLYHAGMALNDYADRDQDAGERPERPLPSGRVSPGTALTASGTLAAAGLLLAARAGRPALLVAGTLTVTAGAYDLGLKHHALGPAVMATARGLDLLLGAAATDPVSFRRALAPAAALGAHTWAVTAVSRQEAGDGASAGPPTGALLTSCAIGLGLGLAGRSVRGRRRGRRTAGPVLAAATAVYLATAVPPLIRAAAAPAPANSRRAVASGIRAVIPLQAALCARSGSATAALALLTLAPIARHLAERGDLT